MYFYSANYLKKTNKMCELNIIKDFDNIEIKIYKESDTNEYFSSDNLKLNVKIIGLLNNKQQFSIFINDIFHSFSLPNKIHNEKDIEIFKNKNIACKFYHQEQIMQFILNDDITLTYPLNQIIVYEN